MFTELEQLEEQYARTRAAVTQITHELMLQALTLATVHFPDDPRLDATRDLVRQREVALARWGAVAEKLAALQQGDVNGK